MAAATLPISLSSSVSVTRDSDRGTGSRFAQLVSKFEILNAMSSMSQATAASKPFTHSCSDLSIGTQAGPRRVEISSSGQSSLVSPSQTSPARRHSRAPGRSPTPTAESNTQRGKGFQLCARHKSVAERRRMFEEGGETGSSTQEHTGDSSSPRSSLSAIPSRAQSKQGALGLLRRGQHKRAAVATLYASASVSTALPKPLALPQEQAQTGPRANRAGESRFRDLPPLDTSGKVYASQGSPWVSTSSSSALALKNESGVVAGSSPRSSGQRTQVQSRIPRPVYREVGQQAKYSPSTSLRSLRSATTPYQSPTTSCRQPTTPRQGFVEGEARQSRKSFKSPGIWATKKSDSPLRDKIGLFEALQRQGREGTVLPPTSKGSSRDNPSYSDYRRRISGAGKSLKYVQLKGTLRRLSRSWRRSSSEQSISHQNSPTRDKNGTDDTWWLKSDTRTGKKAAFPSLSAENARSESSTYSNIEKRHISSFPSASKGARSSLWAKSSSSAQLPFTDQGYNVDGEGGSQTHLPTSPPLSKISHPKFYLNDSCAGRPQAAGKSLEPHQLSGSGLPAPDGQLHASQGRFRRRISRSGGLVIAPLVANAVCSLEQPRPVRANELKRLVSLCKDKVARRISSGNGDRAQGHSSV